MNTKSTTHALTVMACAVGLVLAASQASADDITTQAATPPAPVTAPLLSTTLDSMVAPIALYPDALVAQCLNAATFPDEIGAANDWLNAHSGLTGATLTSAVNAQSWDPSVKALTQFPSVLSNMAQNLAWASSLGEAYHNQPSDVMVAVQAMRAKAQDAGTLKSTPQIRVIQQSPQTIVIQPANPQVVYVPQYNPTVVYGVPYVVPYYTRPIYVAPAPVITFGAGINIGAGFVAGIGIAGGGGGFHWGFNAWNVNWGGGGGTVIYNHTTYINNSVNIWHGNRYVYNGYRPWGPGPHGPWPYGPHPYGPQPYGPHPNGFGPHPYGPPAPGSAAMQRYDNHLANKYTADGGDTWRNDGYGPRGSGRWAPGSPAWNHYDNAMANRYPADGGDTWKHDGYGPVNPAREGFGPNGNGYRHDAEVDNGGRNLGGETDHFNSFAGNRAHSGWSGNGASSRAESFRGRASMAHMRAPSFHEGGGRRR